MANKKFLEKIKKQPASSANKVPVLEPSLAMNDYDDEDIDLGTLGGKIFQDDEMKVPKPKNKTEIQDKKEFAKKIEESLDEDFGGHGVARSVDLSNIPKITSLNIEDEGDDTNAETNSMNIFEEKDQDEENDFEFGFGNGVPNAPKAEDKHSENIETKNENTPKKRGRGRPKATVYDTQNQTDSKDDSAKITEMENTIKELHSKIQSLKDTIKTKEESIVISNNVIKDLNDKLESTMKELEDLKSSGGNSEALVEKDKIIDSLKSEIKQNQSCIDNLTENINSLESEISNKNKIIKQLELANSEMKSAKIMTENSNEIKDSFNDVANKVLGYVCIQTIKTLLDKYKSEMYTEAYSSKLFNGFIAGEVDSSNPLFKELIGEVIKSEFKDDYLDDLTVDVLNYIKGRNV